MSGIIPIGGRIKCASVGLDHLFPLRGTTDEAITTLRQNPPDYLSRAFFPRTGKELTQALRGIGFFRPSLKTDQGMAGNFLPFQIDMRIETSDLSPRTITYQEGCALPETWYAATSECIDSVQAAFHAMDLRTVYALLQSMETRVADKGRLPFFLIRPALLDTPRVFGKDIVSNVEAATKVAIDRCIEAAAHIEYRVTGSTQPARITYLQPDVFIGADGSVTVEKLNCPDVGFFLGIARDVRSRVLPHIRDIVIPIQQEVADALLAHLGKHIVIVTRDAVLDSQEDVLELMEISSLEQALTERGVEVRTIGVSDVTSLSLGSRLLLMNLDYRAPGVSALLSRHARREVTCYPNPYFQIACAHVSAMKEVVLSSSDKHYDRFLAWARSQPRGEEGRMDVLRNLNAPLSKSGIAGSVVHALLQTETVPVLRDSLHAWRQLEARARREGNCRKPIRFREIPLERENLLITSDTGPHLHAYRFMYLP